MNFNQFYDWTAPDHSVVLHTFRIYSPMKGAGLWCLDHGGVCAAAVSSCCKEAVELGGQRFFN
jgi:hypothetical protein